MWRFFSSSEATLSRRTGAPELGARLGGRVEDGRVDDVGDDPVAPARLHALELRAQVLADGADEVRVAEA